MKWLKSLLTVIALLLTLLPSHAQSLTNIEQATSNDLGIIGQAQLKDTRMLCLQGCSLLGEHAWDIQHKTYSYECSHCRKYCVRAAIAMINNYYGGNISQDRISFYILAEIHSHPPETDLGHGRGFTVDQATSALSWALNGAEIYHIEEMPSFEQIMEWIDSNRPIMKWQGIHVTVIDGYDTNGQLVHVIGEAADGTESAIPYDTLSEQEWWPWVPPANATARNDEPEIWMDTDSDGLVDFDEINRFFTDPYNPDTDGDLVPDKAEIRSYTFLSDDSFDEENIRIPDVDWDGLRAELDPDSDDGGCPDGFEDLNGNGRVDSGETDPLFAYDDPERPSAGFEYSPDSPQIFETVTFDATSSFDPDGNIKSYEWNFDEGSKKTVADPITTHYFEDKGKHNVSLTVTDNVGLNDTTWKTVNVTGPEVHDIAITDVKYSKSIVPENYTVKINCTIMNRGDVAETFDVDLYLNTSVFETKNLTLNASESEILIYIWNTTSFQKGNYTLYISAPLPNDTHVLDNSFVGGWLVITILGDTNGDYRVDYKDLFLLASCYGSSTGDPNADLNSDSKVDYNDLFILAANYGKTA